MKATIRDVARKAGVSVATVSRVINDSGPVSPDTRARIRETARELRYTPNSAARSLSVKRSHTLGALLPDLYGEFFSEVIRGIDETAQQHHHHLLISSSHNDRAQIAAALRAMRGRVDGLLLMSPGVDGETLAAELPEELPVVLLNCPVRDARYATLAIDNRRGARAMVEHLLAIGHRRIAFIRGAARNHDARERLTGYRAALRAAGIAREAELELAGDFTESGGHAAACAALRLRPRPTAIFAANDAMALGALSAVRQHGMRVPDDIAVVGFDDIPVARYLTPPLTTVQVGISALGERAATILLQMLSGDGPPSPVHAVLPTSLVVRASCGASGQG